MKHIKVEEGQQIFKDIVDIMKITFPYYERDDKDSYYYLVQDQHINTATMKILKYIDNLKEQSLISQKEKK